MINGSQNNPSKAKNPPSNIGTFDKWLELGRYNKDNLDRKSSKNLDYKPPTVDERKIPINSGSCDKDKKSFSIKLDSRFQDFELQPIKELEEIINTQSQNLSRKKFLIDYTQPISPIPVCVETPNNDKLKILSPSRMEMLASSIIRSATSHISELVCKSPSLLLNNKSITSPSESSPMKSPGSGSDYIKNPDKIG